METQKNGNGAPEGQALALYRPTGDAYEPKNLQEARLLAKSYAESKLVPGIVSESAALLIMATGHEVGIPATAALRSISVINGRPALSAQLKIALCVQRKDLCKFFRVLESTDTSATYQAWRHGDEEPMKVTFTIQDAKNAGLVKPDSNWVKYPRRMLRWRAGSELADMLFPEVMLGLPSAEDLIDDRDHRAPIIAMDAEVVDQPQPPAAQQEPTPAGEDLFAKWAQDLKDAVTLKDCDEVAAEMQKACPADSPEREKGRLMFKARKDEIRGKKPE